MSKAYIFQACLVFLIIPSSYQCGISTHIDIAHQAIQWFDDQRENTSYRKLILNHQDAFIAGNPYPDAMYSSLCYKGKFHQVAEDTHWSPFLNATVNYIRNKYPKPWTKETEKLVVFMLGFVSHQVADVTWHSLGIQQGFLQTMGKVNFYGSFPAAHNVGDAGGDMVATLEGDTEKISSSVENWYVPTEDLAGIYNEYYGKEIITSDEILKCTKVLYLGWIGEKVGGAKLFKKYASKSPFLMEDLHSYFQGGIYDMAAWSGLIWHDAIDMLEHGTNTCHIPESPLFIHCNKSKDRPTQALLSKTRLKNPGTIFQPEALEGLSLNDVKTIKTDQGSYLYATGSLQEKLLSWKTDQLKQKAVKESFDNKIRTLSNFEEDGLESALYTTKVPYANLGWSLAKGNFSGSLEAVAISAPNYGTPGRSQYGRVYVVYADKDGALPLEDMDLDSKAHTILDGMVDNGRFGTALAVVDLNRDGVDDLAVSAPSTGANSLQYTGTVYVYYGTLGKGLSSKPNQIINAKGQYYNLGTTLMGADIDSDGYKDLIIGSPYAPEGGPQRGSVSVFLAKTPRKPGVDLSVSDADWKITGEQDFSWFGYDVELIFHDKQPLLVITAPTFRICSNPGCKYSSNDTQSVGKIYVYTLTEGVSSPYVTVTGHDTFMKFGTSVAFGRPRSNTDILAVSASTQSVQGHVVKAIPVTFEQCGTIYLLDVAEIMSHKGNLSLTQLRDVTIFEGDRSYARFGWAVDFADLNLDGVDDLMFSSPFRTSDLTEELKGAEEGEAYAFFGGPGFPTGKATRGCTLIDPCPADKASMVFKSSEERSRLGTSFITLHVGQSKFVNLLVASPRSSLTRFHSGKLRVYKIAPARKNKIRDYRSP